MGLLSKVGLTEADVLLVAPKTTKEELVASFSNTLMTEADNPAALRRALADVSRNPVCNPLVGCESRLFCAEGLTTLPPAIVPRIFALAALCAAQNPAAPPAAPPAAASPVPSTPSAPVPSTPVASPAAASPAAASPAAASPVPSTPAAPPAAASPAPSSPLFAAGVPRMVPDSPLAPMDFPSLSTPKRARVEVNINDPKVLTCLGRVAGKVAADIDNLPTTRSSPTEATIVVTYQDAERFLMSFNIDALSNHLPPLKFPDRTGVLTTLHCLTVNGNDKTVQRCAFCKQMFTKRLVGRVFCNYYFPDARVPAEQDHRMHALCAIVFKGLGYDGCPCNKPTCPILMQAFSFP